jgi:hypothetical protein
MTIEKSLAFKSVFMFVASLAIRRFMRARRLQDLGKIEAAGDSGNSIWHGLRGGMTSAQDHAHDRRGGGSE